MTIEAVQSLDLIGKMLVHLVLDDRIVCGVRMGTRGHHVWWDYASIDDATAATTCPRCRKKIDADTHLEPPKPRAKRTPKSIVVDGVALHPEDLVLRRGSTTPSYLRNAIKYDGGRRAVQAAFDTGAMYVVKLWNSERDDLPERFADARRDRYWIDWVPSV